MGSTLPASLFLQFNAGSWHLNQEADVMGFAIVGHFEEDNFGLFNQGRHAHGWLVQSGEEVVPVQWNDQLRSDFFHGFGEELSFRLLVGLGQSGNT